MRQLYLCGISPSKLGVSLPVETGEVGRGLLNVWVVIVDVGAPHAFLNLFAQLICGALPAAVVLIMSVVLTAYVVISNYLGIRNRNASSGVTIAAFRSSPNAADPEIYRHRFHDAVWRSLEYHLPDLGWYPSKPFCDRQVNCYFVSDG